MNRATRYLIELEPTSRAVVDAHEAHVRTANDGVRWERRGLLQRLTRVDGSGPDGDSPGNRGRGG